MLESKTLSKYAKEDFKLNKVFEVNYDICVSSFKYS